MMSCVIAKQEAEKHQAELDRLASKAKIAAQAKLREINPNFDKQRTAAIANNKRISKQIPVDLSFVSNTVRAADIVKVAKSPRVVRPPPQKTDRNAGYFLWC
jgi:transcription elongation GreA/GreB family factor